MQITTQLPQGNGLTQPDAEESLASSATEKQATQATVTKDTVQLSKEAQQTLAQKPVWGEVYDYRGSGFDWENRTINGKSTPDNFYKEKTPEMLSGEQPYHTLISLVGDEPIYEAVDYTPQEYQLEFDASMLQAKQDVITRYKEGLVEAEQKLQSAQDEPRPDVRRADIAAHSLAKDWLEGRIAEAESSIGQYLKNSLISFERLGINHDEAQEGLAHYSGGKLDFLKMLEAYL